MIRIATLAAVAAALIALPASAQTDSIRISTTGKSPDQLHAEITRAAETLCSREMLSATFLIGAYADCVRKSVNVAVAKVPALADMAKPTRMAVR